jgi:hypothetical protein
MSLRHILWRMSEQRTAPVNIAVRGACSWPGCEAGCVEWTMRLRPQEPKPLTAACVLCGRELQILSAVPLRQEASA